MKQDYLSETTIKETGRKLRHMAKLVNLNNPKEVTKFIANKKGKNSYKETLAYARAHRGLIT
jgi:hypothetical protein